MTAAEWNQAYKPGQPVEVTRVDGTTFRAYTVTEAFRVGEHEYVELFGYRGLWLLGWCRALPR